MTDEGGEVRPTSGENTGSTMAVASTGERHFQTPRANIYICTCSLFESTSPRPGISTFQLQCMSEKLSHSQVFRGPTLQFSITGVESRPRVSKFVLSQTGSASRPRSELVTFFRLGERIGCLRCAPRVEKKQTVDWLTRLLYSSGNIYAVTDRLRFT